MKIAIGADSAGKPLLNVIAEHLAGETGLEASDLSQPGYYADLRQGSLDPSLTAKTIAAF